MIKYIYFLLISFKIADSQHLEWAKTIKASEYSESYIIAHKIDNDGNHYILTSINGEVNFDLNNRNDTIIKSIEKNKYTIVLAKYDSLQNFKWARSFTTDLLVSYSNYWGGFGFDVDNSSNVFLFGNYSNSIIIKNEDSSSIIKLVSKGSYDFFVMKMDGNGNTNWIKNFGNKSHDFCDKIKIFEEELYIAGFLGDSFNIKIKDSTYFYNPVIKNQQDVFLAKLNTKGDIYWFNHIKLSSNILSLNDIHINKNGIKVLIGGTNSKIEVVVNDTSYSETIGYMEFGSALLDFNLEGKFKKFYIFRSVIINNGTNLNRVFNKIAVDSTQNLYLVGRFLKSGIIKLNSPFSPDFYTNPGVILLKMDTFGKILWIKNYKSPSLFHYTFDFVSINIYNKKLYLSGDFKDSISFPTLNYNFVLKSKNQNNAFLSIHDLEGDFLSAFGLKSPNFTNNTSLEINLKDNTIYWTGNYRDSTNFAPTSVPTYLESKRSLSSFICKYNSILIPLDSIERGENNSSIKEPIKNKIETYPNPTFDYLNIGLSSIPNFVSLKVLDIIGRVITTQIVQKQKDIKVDLSAIPKGIYILEIVIDHSQNQCFKIRKE